MQSGIANSKIERPKDLHLQTTFCDENINITFRSSSEDEFSPDMNCKKVNDKPTLVSARHESTKSCLTIILSFSLKTKSG